MRWVARAPNVIGGDKNSIFESFRFPAPKVAWDLGAGDRKLSKMEFFDTPHDIGGPGYPSHPFSILMRLATYLYILYIYVIVLAASWHKR